MGKKFLNNSLFAVILLFSLSACGGDNSSNTTDDCNGETWSQIAKEEITALSNAAVAYYENPTPQTCEAYEGALKSYINILEDLNLSCLVDASEEDINEAIADAEQDINTINCSEMSDKD